MSKKSHCSHSATHCIGLAFAALYLRLFIGMRLFFAGLEKWKVKVTVDENGDKLTEAFWKYDLFNAETYNEKMGPIVAGMHNDSALPMWMIEQYAGMLGWMLLIVGAWVLIGIASRTALVAAGGVFLSLTFGLSVIGADPELAQRGIEIGIIAGALALARYQVFGVDGLIRLAMGGGSKSASDDEPSPRKKD